MKEREKEMSEKKYVSYEDFGAIGDGVADDFEAIEAAHIYANANGLEVKAKSDATYYVGEKLTREIPVKTNVDWNGANIIINDNASNAYQYRAVNLFAFRRESKLVLEGEALIAAIGEGRTIKKGDTSFPWLLPVLNEDSLIRVTNSGHRDFVRFGCNENGGVERRDMFEVSKDGTLDPETDVAYEFDNITKIEIFPAHETPITVKNGNFASICCRTVKETDFLGRWHGYERGFLISRADVTLENITHRMIDEPELDTTRDELAKTYGNRGESYPYEGFIVGRIANRLTLKNCRLTAHTTYYEDKPATVSTGWQVPPPVALGSYDMYFQYCNRVSLINVKHDCTTGIADNKYWGIMASNNCKNFLLDGCDMNRFDAHQGFWNTKIVNSTFGHSINITGGGHLYMENVTKLTGYTFLSVRGDYGSSFEGDIVIKNCRHESLVPYNTTRTNETQTDKPTYSAYLIGLCIVGGNYERFYNWDFGYGLYLPTKITLDGFTWGTNGKFYVYDEIKNEAFDGTYKHSHNLTEKIVCRNMSAIPEITSSEKSTALKSIPIVLE